jgi:hypothetical protein
MRSSSLSKATSNVSSLADEFVARASDYLAHACYALAGENAGFADFEAQLYACANEAVRQQLQRRLEQIANEHGDRVVVDGKRYQRHHDGDVEYHTLVGEVRVRRATYREVGVRNGPTIVPLELSAGMIHRASPALAYSIAHGYGAGPIRHYEAQLQAAHRSLPPHATVERLARRIGGSAARDVVRIEADVRRDEQIPSGAHAIAVSLDRTSVAMAEERPPTAAPNSPRRVRRKPLQRRPPHPFDVNWRMIYVGTVSIVDENGEVLTTRKYHATPEEETDEIMARMMADVVHCRAEKPLRVVVVQDGAPEMWNVMRPALRRVGVERWTEIIDRFHAKEHIAAALELIEPDKERRQRRYAKWQRQLDQTPRAIYRIAKWLESQWWKMPKGSEKSRTLGSHTGYITGYARMMNYAAYRRSGLPIGSGPVEGACKSLVAARCKRSGQRWKQDGLTAALTLRAVEQSDRLPAFWSRFSNQFRATINAA